MSLTLVSGLLRTPSMVNSLNKMHHQMRSLQAATQAGEALSGIGRVGGMLERTGARSGEISQLGSRMNRIDTNNVNLRQNTLNSSSAYPVYNPPKEGVENTETVEAKDNVGAFANMLKDAFESVNTLQNEANNKQTRFDVGDRSITLSDVVLSSQKAAIAFEATLQVRNRMIEAYKTISQMQV